MNDPSIHVYSDLPALSAAAARDAADLLRATAPGRPVLLCLSGGSTPRAFHRELATTYRDSIPWERVHVFWGDERYVPANHPERNDVMADETLLRDVPIPPEHVHRVAWDEGLTPDDAAARYEEELRRVAGDRDGITFDLTLLGLGDDGHTASLFPGTPVLREAERWAAAGQAPATATVRERVTLTYPALNLSRRVFFLAAGRSKHAPLQAILADPGATRDPYPAAGITAAEGVHWFVDATAYAGA